MTFRQARSRISSLKTRRKLDSQPNILLDTGCPVRYEAETQISSQISYLIPDIRSNIFMYCTVCLRSHVILAFCIQKVYSENWTRLLGHTVVLNFIRIFGARIIQFRTMFDVHYNSTKLRSGSGSGFFPRHIRSNK